MNDNLNTMLSQWTAATADLKWGVQRVFHDVFAAAAAEQTTLIYGADYRDGKPCLVNTVGSMLTTGGGHGVPSMNFGKVVSLFDSINAELFNRGLQEQQGYVSPLAADILLRNFAPLKEAPPVGMVDSEPVVEALHDAPYRERTDEELAADVARLFMTDAPCEVNLDDLKVQPINVDQEQ